MSDFAKTGVTLGAAAALSVVAFMMKPGEVRLDLYKDQGEEFFANFDSPDKIAELEVTAFREESSDIYAFAVSRDEKGVWRIPSHGNYPADANDQMGKAAAMMIGLKKESVVGDEKGRHAEYGVVDPLEAGVDTAGRGKRVKLKDSAGNVLADLIVGDAIEGKPDMFYVRVPEKKRVYKATLKGSLSTQFADWIETDLLKAKSYNVNKVVFDNYSVDEQRGQVVPGEKLVLAKSTDNKWLLEGVTEAEETNETRAGEVATALGEIKIVGVRPKPDGLTARLERANGIEAQVLAQQLRDKGYFLARGGKLFSNEGDLLFETKSGVRYTLRFGELVLGEGDEVTAGIGKAEPKEGDEASAEEARKNAKNRYLMVTAEFVEDLLDKPTGVRLPQEELDKRLAARKMIESIQSAIASYQGSHENKLPASLADLAEKPAEGEPLLAEVAKDPWGNDYSYAVEGDTYVLSSFAADAAADGEGVNQDVRSDQLPLENVLQDAAGEWETYDSKVETGQKEAEELTKRFGPWYYVIDKELFDKLKPGRSDLVQPKSAEAPAGGSGAGPGGLPGGGPGGLPGVVPGGGK